MGVSITPHTPTMFLWHSLLLLQALHLLYLCLGWSCSLIPLLILIYYSCNNFKVEGGGCNRYLGILYWIMLPAFRLQLHYWCRNHKLEEGKGSSYLLQPSNSEEHHLGCKPQPPLLHNGFSLYRLFCTPACSVLYFNITIIHLAAVSLENSRWSCHASRKYDSEWPRCKHLL